MTGQLLSVTETADLISSGAPLLIAGDPGLISQLPSGMWIAGTIPYFMGEEGGEVTKDRLFVSQLPAQVTSTRIASYGPDELSSIPKTGFDNGYSIVIVPAFTEVHARYAEDAPDWEGIFDRPVVGWVSGVHLDDPATTRPQVYAGSAEGSSDVAVAMHAELPDGILASANIVNLFRQGDGAVLTFADTGFGQTNVYVDGEQRNFGEYLLELGHDVRLPLVADYFGAMINVSLRNVPEDGGAVDLYAPVFSGIEYKLAEPIDDYVTEFTAQLPVGTTSPAFACNCILNFLYSELEGKKTGDVTGPITFGEIAFQLLNQTLVYLTIHE